MEKKYKWKNLRKLPPMHRLFDRWVPESLTMIGALKFLQFLRLLGVRATNNGWRKVTSIFLRGESSKFTLGSFRLLPDAQAVMLPPGKGIAFTRLAAKLAAHLRSSNAIEYWVEPGKLAFVRRRYRHRDLMLAEVDKLGMIIKITPFFDRSHRSLEQEASPLLNEALQIVVYCCNKLHAMPETARAVELLKQLKNWARSKSRFNYFGRRRRMWMVQRILHSTVLFCDVLESSDEAELIRERFTMPDFRKFRNPGLGMLSVVARFTRDFREVDLWCQFNHVAADGMPMQEFLNKLKKEWGSAGEVRYPPVNSGNLLAGTQVRYAGEGHFRALFFLDFQPLLILRNYLNAHYREAMNGSAMIAGLLMWGLTRHEAFANRKILLPVDGGEFTAEAHDGERRLELLMIRPRQFARHGNNPLEDYCAFQKELNLRFQQARSGGGAVSEFLELCSLLPPLFYHVAKRLWPRALDEVLGTAGLSILRDSEMFISPLTEFQRGGFIAVGNISMPTVDGGYAGAVSVAGSRDHIRQSLEALRHLPEDLLRMLDENMIADAQAGMLTGKSNSESDVDSVLKPVR